MKRYTYVLRCADDTLYCGWTNDLTARLAAHNSGKGAKYTRGRGPVTLVYSEMFDTQSEAMQREAAIKKLTRPQKQALIDSQNGGELLTVYDADGRASGERPRAVVHAQGLSHHVCHLWVVGERISAGVERIGSEAFGDCKNLKKITLSEGLKEIGYSFIKNTAVTSLIVPGTVENVNSYFYGGEIRGATDGALQLEEVIFEAGIKKIPGCFCSNSQLNNALVRVGIPESVEEVGDYAFYNCAGMEEINLVKGIGKIGYYAFYNCKSLKKIEFKKNEKLVT